MTEWKKASKHGDLLIGPDQCRKIIYDRGIEWVTDRYVIARTDLWSRPMIPRNPHFILFPSKLVRARLSEARVEAVKPFEIARDGDRTILRIGLGLHGVNTQAWDGWNKIAFPRASRTSGWISWWQVRRGREVLVGVLAGVLITWPTARSERAS